MPPNKNSADDYGFEDEPEIPVEAADDEAGGSRADDGSVINLEKEPEEPPQRRKCGWCMIASFVVTSLVILTFIIIAAVYEEKSTPAPASGIKSSLGSIQCNVGQNFDYDYTICNSANDGYSRAAGYCLNGVLTPDRNNTNNIQCEADRPYCQMCGDNSLAVCVSDKAIDICTDVVRGTCSSSSNYTIVSPKTTCEASTNTDSEDSFLNNPTTCTSGAFSSPESNPVSKKSCGTDNNKNPSLSQCLNCGQGLTSCVDNNSMEAAMTCNDIYFQLTTATPTPAPGTTAPPTRAPTTAPTRALTDVPTTSVPTTSVPTSSAPNPVVAPTHIPTAIPATPAPAFIPPPTSTPVPTNAAGSTTTLPPTTISLVNYCYDDPNVASNANAMQEFLRNNSNSPIYVVELLNFDTTTAANSYQTLLQSLGGGSKLAFFLTRSSQWPSSSRPEWSHAFIMEYPTAVSFVTLYLNNNQTQLHLDSSRSSSSQYAVYMATKDTNGSDTYPGLFATTTAAAELVFFHGLEFSVPNGNVNVSIFDEQTNFLKVQYGITALAWLNTTAGAMCSNSPTPQQLELDQIRLEGVRSLKGFASLLEDPTWSSASVYRHQGITSNSFSGFAGHNDIL